MDELFLALYLLDLLLFAQSGTLLLDLFLHCVEDFFVFGTLSLELFLEKKKTVSDLQRKCIGFPVIAQFAMVKYEDSQKVKQI